MALSTKSGMFESGKKDREGVGYKDDRLISNYNKELTEYQVREGTEVICDLAFMDSKLLRKIVLPDSVEAIGKAAFSGCQNLQSINIPEGVEVIRERTFKDCSSLRKLELPRSVEKIESGVFPNGLEELTLHSKDVEISKTAFIYCKTLKVLYTYPAGIDYYEELLRKIGCNAEVEPIFLVDAPSLDDEDEDEEERDEVDEEEGDDYEEDENEEEESSEMKTLWVTLSIPAAAVAAVRIGEPEDDELKHPKDFYFVEADTNAEILVRDEDDEEVYMGEIELSSPLSVLRYESAFYNLSEEENSDEDDDLIEEYNIIEFDDEVDSDLKESWRKISDDGMTNEETAFGVLLNYLEEKQFFPVGVQKVEGESTLLLTYKIAIPEDEEFDADELDFWYYADDNSCSCFVDPVEPLEAIINMRDRLMMNVIKYDNKYFGLDKASENGFDSPSAGEIYLIDPETMEPLSE